MSVLLRLAQRRILSPSSYLSNLSHYRPLHTFVRQLSSSSAYVKPLFRPRLSTPLSRPCPLPLAPRRFAYVPPVWEPMDAKTLAKSNSGILWVNNLYPIKIHRFDIRSLVFSLPIDEKLKNMFPLEEIKILGIEARVKEGGAYVFFDYTGPIQKPLSEVVDDLYVNFREQNKYFHLAWKPARCYLVVGKPYVDDLRSRIPTSILRITFKGGDMLQDDMFRLLRKYGQIFDIVAPKDTKGKYYVYFERPEGAIAARNCLHNAKIGEVTILVDYKSVQRLGYIMEQFKDHPRIMIPLVAFLFTIGTVLLFDPLRSYFIKRKMNKPYIDTHQDSNSMFMPWEPRQGEEQALRDHVDMHPRSISVLTGPKGCGKSALLQRVLRGRPNTLYVDCSQDVTTDEDFVEHLSRSIGFFPSFGIVSSGGNFLDALLPTTKNAFTSTVHSQLESMFKCLDKALDEKANHYPINPHEPHPYSIVVFDGLLGVIRGMDDKESAAMLLDGVVTWAISAAQRRAVAHVFFVSSDQFAAVSLAKHIDQKGGGKLEVFQVEDIPLESGLEYLEHGLPGANKTDLHYAASKIGGRFDDMETFLQKVYSGMPPREAVDQMIAQTVRDLRSEGFDLAHATAPVPVADPKKGAVLPPPKWTRAQIWETIRRLSLTEADTIGYDELLFNVFMGDSAALNALITSNLLRLHTNTDQFHSSRYTSSGMQQTLPQNKPPTISTELVVSAFSPLHRAAFQEMVTDPILSLGMNIIVKKTQLDEEMSKLVKIEDELVKLKDISSAGVLGSEPASVSKRRALLEEKMRDLAIKIEGIDRSLKEMVKRQQDYTTQFENRAAVAQRSRSTVTA